MGIVGIWLLALSLAMDCFSVSLASGIILKRIDNATFFKMGFFFGLFQALMPVIGWFGASALSEHVRDYDHWIAFVLLVFLGVRMIRESFKNVEEVTFDPTKFSVIITGAIATSIDALAIGISFAFIDMPVASMVQAVVIIGIVSFAMSLIGSYSGAIVGKRLRFRMEWLGGIVLIALGAKILCEHLGLLA